MGPSRVLSAEAGATPRDARLARGLAELSARLAPLRSREGGRADVEAAHAVSHRLAAQARAALPALADPLGAVERTLREIIQARRPLGEGEWQILDAALDDAGAALDQRAAPRPPDDAVVATGRVLLVEPQAEIRRALTATGRAHLLDVVAVERADEALARLSADHAEVALVAIDPAAPGDGLALVRRLRALAGDALPVACVSGSEAVADRISAVHAGASLFLRRPLGPVEFVNAVRHLQALRIRDQPRVLLVDDDPETGAALKAMLEAERMQVTWLRDPQRVLELLPEVRADLLLLDVEMPGLSGFEVCRMLRATPHWQALPILLLTSRLSPELRLAAFQAGADDYLARPLIRRELLARIQVRLERARLARERADRDSLTGLLVRRAFNDALLGWLAEARRTGRPVSLCLLDLDHFKRVNDTYGHLAGDRVLCGLGQLLSRSFRTEDLRGRWGGEEFVVAFNNEGLTSARDILERARREFTRLVFEGDHGERFGAHFSAGIATFPEDGASVEALLRVADERLFAAKAAGRDRIEPAAPPVPDAS